MKNREEYIRQRAIKFENSLRILKNIYKELVELKETDPIITPSKKFANAIEYIQEEIKFRDRKPEIK